MNVGIFDHLVSFVAVDARVTVIQTPVHAHRLASNAKYVTSVLIGTQNEWLCHYITI
jgi:hypothetical protein